MKNLVLFLFLSSSLLSVINAQQASTVTIVQAKSQKSLDVQVLMISGGELEFKTASGGPFKVKIADLTEDSVIQLRTYWQNRQKTPATLEPSDSPPVLSTKNYQSIEISEDDIDARQIRKSYKSEFRKFGISYDVKDTMEADKYGEPASIVDVYRDLGEFFAALHRLDPNFVKKSQVTQVFFKSPLIDPVSGKRVGGMGGNSGKMWFNSKKVSAYVVFHELFHVFDDKGENWTAWGRTNPKDYTYRGSQFRPEDLNRREIRENEEKKGDFATAFVTGYAMSNQVEDRAETFTHMIIKGYHLVEQAAENKYLKEKIELIVDMTSKSRLLGKDYWETLLTEDIREIKKLSKPGLACRLIIDLRRRNLDADEVIEIAGEKVIPLIFALEESNTELVELLCSASVNFDVKNEEGLTPLQLAIENESEPQILALLKLGAKPTTNDEVKYLDSTFDG